jgi:uncharacterized delta-60 repeat protein
MKNIFRKLAFIFIAISLTCLSSFAASPGSLDPGFGVAGRITTNLVSDDVVGDIAVQDDGKIVVVGSSGVNDFTVTRYNANGNLDASFNGDGKVFTDFGSNFEFPSGVVIQTDGKTVVCGRVGNNNTGIARYTINGALDTNFDTDGKQSISNVVCTGLAIQPDGKIIGVGNSINIDLIVFRLNQNGTFDTTFDSDGFVSTVIGGGGNSFSDVKLQQDGKIVAVGALGNQAQSVFARYNTNGTIDNTFGGTGIVVLDFASTEYVKNLAIDPVDNSIIAVGRIGAKINVVRFTSGGVLDTSFDTDGWAEIAITGLDFGEDIAIQSDRKILISSFRNAGTNLLRLNRNGTFDTTFGNNGIVSTRFSFNAGQPVFMKLNGNNLVVGNTVRLGTAVGFNDFGVQRYNLSATPTQESDFDGDAFTDSAVFRPSTGNWFILNSATNTVTIDQFGANGDVPIGGDFDGDGKSDVSIYRPSVGEWYFKRSSDNTVTGATFGGAGDKPIAGDYDKDGKTDMAIFRPGNGNWFVLRSSTNFSTFFAYPFGQAGDIPIPISGS